MIDKKLTLTIVIPVYNEERYLKACLDSIKRQTVAPDEVIVVDNNSTDDSMQIARKYNFVKILHEKRQHQVFAQAKGFNAAKGDILGRIDADSVLPASWAEKVRTAFADNNVVGITGGAEPYDVPLKRLGLAIFYFYHTAYSLIAGTQMLFGGNCALRRSAWRKIRNEIHYRPDVWEDYDMAFCLNRLGSVRYIHRLVVDVSFRAVHKPFFKQVSYQFRAVRTFYLRTNILQTAMVAVLWTTMLIVYPFTVLDYWLLEKKNKDQTYTKALR